MGRDCYIKHFIIKKGSEKDFTMTQCSLISTDKLSLVNLRLGAMHSHQENAHNTRLKTLLSLLL